MLFLRSLTVINYCDLILYAIERESEHTNKIVNGKLEIILCVVRGMSIVHCHT